jgi:hypothetical protein
MFAPKKPYIPSWIKIILVNLSIFFVLLIVVDLIISMSPVKYMLVADSFRVLDKNLHHSLAPNVSGFSRWGHARYPYYTNSLGFRDNSNRNIKLVSDRSKRVVVIGDSFVEATGLTWEETFVGLFAAAFPNVEVLNAGLYSYSPSIYLRKIQRVLSSGYKLDHVIIYIDISDIQDEAVVYDEDADGNVIYSKYYVDMGAHIGDVNAVVRRKDLLDPSVLAFFHEYFSITSWVAERVVGIGQRWISKIGPAAESNERPADSNGISEVTHVIRSMWTVDSDLNPGYGERGVRGGIAKAIEDMTKLAALLRSHSIKFSVGVYPWPDQIMFDKKDSLQVEIWKAWCLDQGCFAFLDHFDDFFKIQPPIAAYKKYYIPGDAHLNAVGNALLADRLIQTFQQELKDE